MGTLFEFNDDGLRCVATDGHRLVNLLNKNVKAAFNQQYVVPERAVSVLTKVLDEKDVKINLTKSYVSFKLNDMELITRLIAQKYPTTQALFTWERIPHESKHKRYSRFDKENDVILNIQHKTS